MTTPYYTFFTDLEELELDDDADFDFDADLNSYDDNLLYRSQQRYTDILLKLQNAEEADSDVVGRYKLFMECNLLLAEIENEIAIVHNFISNKYCFKFPELESIVHYPVDYARVVKKIGNQIDPSLFHLQGLLPSSIIMVLSLTSSTTSGKPLSNQELNKIMDACDRAIALDSLKNKIVNLVENRISYVAPNISSVVGNVVAAKLIVTAGGLSSLANMPACQCSTSRIQKNKLCWLLFCIVAILCWLSRANSTYSDYTSTSKDASLQTLSCKITFHVPI